MWPKPTAAETMITIVSAKMRLISAVLVPDSSRINLVRPAMTNISEKCNDAPIFVQSELSEP